MHELVTGGRPALKLLLPSLTSELLLDSDDRDSLLRLDSLCDCDDSDCEVFDEVDDFDDSL